MADEGGASGARIETQPDESTSGRLIERPKLSQAARVYELPRRWAARARATRLRISEAKRSNGNWIGIAAASVLIVGAFWFGKRLGGKKRL